MKFSEMSQLAGLDDHLAEIKQLRGKIDSIPREYFEKPQLFSPRPGGPTGPRTPEGKAISSLNALRTGLTGRTVLLPSDDAEAYASHIEQYRAEYSPVGLRETELVQSLADTSWRLRRIPGLEMALYAQGRCEFAGCFDAHDPSLRAGMIELQTHLKYEKQLRNLQLQESRLHRRYTAEVKELRELQRERSERDKAAREDRLHADRPRPAQLSDAARSSTAAPAGTGFEFSTPSAQPNSAPATNAASAQLTCTELENAA
jgi:hypothetical protein